jgi:hypothetical protein
MKKMNPGETFGIESLEQANSIQQRIRENQALNPQNKREM